MNETRLRRAAWSGVVALVIVGVAGAALRLVHPADSGTRLEPVRQQILEALHVAQPLHSERAAELDRFDSRFAAYPLATLLHVLPGAIFLLLAPLQFLTRGRPRYARLHRWSGRVLVALGVVIAGTALFFGLLMPYGGAGEALAIALFGGLLLVALTTAVVAIRHGRVAEHREWMLRAFAIALAIATVRVAGAIFDIVLTPLGLNPRAQFVLSVWAGWVITLGIAELWIRHTRVSVRPELTLSVDRPREADTYLPR